MSIINNGLLLASGADAPTGYQISRSLRFNGSIDSTYLSRTPSSAGNRKTYTFSFWVKRSALGADQALITAQVGSTQSRDCIRFNSNDTLQFDVYDLTQGTVTTSQVFRDVSSWYHIVVAIDTTQSTASNRVKMYVNGTQVTAFNSASYPSQNADTNFNGTTAHGIGVHIANPQQYFSGYLADIYLLDGTATTPSTFAETDAITGQWVPKTPTSISYGTNGFRLTFSDNSGTTSTTLGKDAAGSNNWTPNNFSVASGSGNDSLVDSPTSYGTGNSGGDVRGNYCTLNPLQSNGGTLSNGNLDYTTSTATVFHAMGTIGVSSGKWYFECTRNAGNSAYPFVGVFKQGGSVGSYLGETSDAWTLILDSTYNGYWRSGGTLSGSSAGTFVNGDIAMVAVDMDAGKIWFGRNGTWAASGNPASGTNAQYTNLSGTVTPAVAMYQSAGATVNFGARAFSYQAPSGFKALCDTNLTAPTIAKPADYFDVKLYTGNGSSITVSGLNFSPDFIWGKNRSAAASHEVYDTIRGVKNGLLPNSTIAELTNDATLLTAFNSDGFTYSSNTGMNGNGNAQVAWCWDAASSNSTNTQGSITSTVRANATAGFSIATFTTPTSGTSSVGHGLGVTPHFVMFKTRSGTSHWICQHVSTGTQYLLLNDTGSAVTSSATWNSLPTSSVVNFGTGFSGYSGATAVMYCFAPVANYSAFGSYTGNGSSDGPFVYTGFRPRFIITKVSAGDTGHWIMCDTARSTYNVAAPSLFANGSGNETSNTYGDAYDVLSNGFKLRTSSGGFNLNTATFVYIAFAENPFQYARAR